MSRVQRTINILIGLVICFIVGFFLFALGDFAHIDLSYDELDGTAKAELWAWRIFSVVVATLLFVWVVRKNNSAPK